MVVLNRLHALPQRHDWGENKRGVSPAGIFLAQSEDNSGLSWRMAEWESRLDLRLIDREDLIALRRAFESRSRK